MIFGFLFGKKNPTTNWPPFDERPLEFELSQGALNGVPCGRPLEHLHFLGPDQEQASSAFMNYKYYRLGLDVDCRSAHQIDSYRIVVRDSYQEGYTAFVGQLKMRGQNVEADTLEQWIHQFGTPEQTDSDESEAVLYYLFPNLEWQVEFDSHAMLQSIIVTDRPTLT